MSVSVFGWAAALLQVAGYLAYASNFKRQKIRPNAASFVMFAYGTAFVFLLEAHNGANAAMLLLPGVCALMSIVVAGMCMRKGATEPIEDIEKVAFAIDLGLTAGYAFAFFAFGYSPQFALMFLLATNITTFTAFFPMVRSTWMFPKRERPGPWVLWTLAYACLTIATVVEGGRAHPALLAYPVINLLIHGTLVVLAMRKVGAGRTYRQKSMAVINRESEIHGYGMFAGRDYSKDQEVWVLKGRAILQSVADDHANAVGFGNGFWIDPEPPFEFVNHSCNANAAFGRDGEFFALRPIAKGEEITLDYSTTESDPHWEMDCSCGAPNCRKRLYAIQIAFANASFPPPAAPGMQYAWRTMREHGAENRPAFPALAPAADGTLPPQSDDFDHVVAFPDGHTVEPAE